MMKKTLSLLSVLILVSGFVLNAQIPLTHYESISVWNGEEMQNPWAGGFNTPQFSEIDLDGDGNLDLVAFERDFYGSVKTFLFKQGQFVYAPVYQSVFPPLRNWMLLRDYNCDGQPDIFTSVPGGVAVYKNIAQERNVPAFVLETSLLLSTTSDGNAPLYVALPDIPSITDVDEDGDLDILSFNVIGSRLVFHRNLSMEKYGDCLALEFEVASECWGYFSEDGNNNTVSLFDTCGSEKKMQPMNERHAGSTVLAIDLTGNDLKDLLLGDITFSNVVMLENGGSQQEASMINQQTDFPGNGQAVDLQMFPAAYQLDVDHDGLKDLVFAPNNPNTSENYDNVWLYKNKGSQEKPIYDFIQDDFLTDGMIDLGESSFVGFLDVNADGLTDIIAGSYGYFESSGTYSSRLTLLRNTGSTETPSFEIVTDDYAQLSIYDFDGIYPAFGDLDQDGDIDMIIGDEEGRVHLFTNQAGPGNPVQFILSEPNFEGIDVGESAKPQIIDVNGDDLADLLIGERGGAIRYYENLGSPGDPVFNEEPSIEIFGGIDVMPACCTGFSAPFFTKDSLGNSILYVGSEQGWLYLFNDIDGNLNGNFHLQDSLYLDGVNVSINGQDINADGKMEFVLGQNTGGLGLLKEGKPFVYGLDEEAAGAGDLHIIPNPAKDMIRVQCKAIPYGHNVDWSIATISGRILIRKHDEMKESLSIDISSLLPGIYILRIHSGGMMFTGKLIVKP